MSRVGTGFIAFSMLFLLYLLGTMSYEMIVTENLPTDQKYVLRNVSERYDFVQTVFGEQRGGTVTPDYTSPVIYTNDTNRFIQVKLTLDHITEEELQAMINDDIKLNIQAKGNIFAYKETFDLQRLIDNNVFDIHLDDKRLDDYRVCVWFGEYDGKSQCENYSKKLNVTTNEIDVSYNLLFVYEDMKSEESEYLEESRE